jgi:uncharacterized protein RhaS with RHS repeats
MSNKSKGSRAERELLQIFTDQSWRAARVAGSGVNENTFCDLIAGKSGKAYALLLGTFVNHFPENSIFNDTQIKDIDLKQNLIILGGPIVNGLTKKINLKLPIRFAKKTIHSTITNKEYHNDKNGIIIKCDNPFDKSKKILLIAGLRLIGTRACILALSKYMEEISKPNIKITYYKN